MVCNGLGFIQPCPDQDSDPPQWVSEPRGSKGQTIKKLGLMGLESVGVKAQVGEMRVAMSSGKSWPRSVTGETK